MTKTNEKQKKCNRCKEELPVEQFHNNSRKKDGKQDQCKTCHKIYNDQYRKKVNNKHQKNWTKREYQTNDLFRYKCLIRAMIRRGFYKNNLKKPLKSQQILGCTFNELQAHFERKFQETYKLPLSYAIEVLGWDIHLDHIVPLSLAKTELDVIRLNHYSNLQLLRAEDNRTKGKQINYEIKPYQDIVGDK